MAVNLPLRIAVLGNTTDIALRYSFRSTIKVAWVWTRICYPPVVDFFDVAVPSSYPNPSDYDLIVLSGGTVDGIYGREPERALQILIEFNNAYTYLHKVKARLDHKFLVLWEFYGELSRVIYYTDPFYRPGLHINQSS
jgi:hypothetical protein